MPRSVNSFSIFLEFRGKKLVIPFKVCILALCVFVLFSAWVLYSYLFILRSTSKVERLTQQLAMERSINANLSREIEKSSKSIENVAKIFASKEPESHLNSGTTKSIITSSNIVLYGILYKMQENLRLIDKGLDAKAQNVRKVVGLTKLLHADSVKSGLGKLNVARSISVQSVQNSTQKASKSFDIFKNITIPNISKKINLKNEGISTLRNTFFKMPIARPITNGRFVSGFGMRFHPIHKRYRPHNGLDFAGPIGSKVHATADGIVQRAAFSKSYGNFVVIKHANNVKTLYAHMKKSHVQKGQKVKAGHIIGIQGSTGTSTGAHLHYEVIVNNEHRDPLNFIRAKALLEDA